jgi:hypothetical protein
MNDIRPEKGDPVETTDPPIEGTATEVGEGQPGQELTIPAAQAPATLFRTDDPVQVLERATEVADALKDVLRQQGMIERIRTKDGVREHVKVEGWNTLGAMLGVTPVTVWTRPIPKGWEARVEARTLDGRVIGAAEAECLTSERRWKSADDYALRSMAQTRATSRALGAPLRFVVTLAGYSGTPAEEMDAEQPQRRPDPQPKGDPLPDERVNELGRGIGKVGVGFERLCLLFGSIGADAPAINRSDSIRKALRALTPDEAEKFEAALSAEADRNG